MPREYKILLSIAVAAIVIGVLMYKFAGTPAGTAPLMDRADAYSKGNPAATIVVTEFADFQCPACRSAAPILNQLLSNYPNTIKIEFRHLPLSMHPLSQLSAQAAEAAGAQGKFWEMYDLLYEKQDEWGDTVKPLSRADALDMFVGYARELTLDEAKFRTDLENNTYSENINADMAAADSSGVNSTPQFFVNQTMIDSPSYAAIKAEIDRQLAQ